MSQRPDVLIVDDHPVTRFGLAQILAIDGRFAVCAEAGTVADAKLKTSLLRPAFAVVDLMLGGRDGIDLVRDLHARSPQSRILAYSAQPELTYAPRAFQAGAAGYLMKDAGIEEVPNALAAMRGGACYASPAVQRAMFQVVAGGRPVPGLGDLSDRELQVLRLLGIGKGTAAIAEDLCLSIKTVGTYRERLKVKLGLESARQLEQRAADYVRTGHL
ncbi:response regulator transcription factor [Aquabacter spiritensis]|uniref:LuxR family two component transcriptional regulator n=1 Tax=Aquabacter spiritensis TaxID=933073 RepID=A0A4V2UYK0_9HYPH|nr:response regulator transcription factor [Aquabacter spiritensis]TCT07738.1 LuxR family two component transcriptional regulator [Aquabacter spiritensis]